MKKLLAVMFAGVALVACSHNESTSNNGDASAAVAEAPATASEAAVAPVASEPVVTNASAAE